MALKIFNILLKIFTITAVILLLSLFCYWQVELSEKDKQIQEIEQRVEEIKTEYENIHTEIENELADEVV